MSQQSNMQDLKSMWNHFKKAHANDDSALKAQAIGAIQQYESLLGIRKTDFTNLSGILMGMRNAGVSPNLNGTFYGGLNGYAPQELARSGINQAADYARGGARLPRPDMRSEPPYPNQPTYGAGQYTTGGPGQLNVPSGYTARQNFSQGSELIQGVGNSQYSNALYHQPLNMSGSWGENSNHGLGSLNMVETSMMASENYQPSLSPQLFSREVAQNMGSLNIIQTGMMASENYQPSLSPQMFSREVAQGMGAGPDETLEFDIPRKHGLSVGINMRDTPIQVFAKDASGYGEEDLNILIASLLKNEDKFFNKEEFRFFASPFEAIDYHYEVASPSTQERFRKIWLSLFNDLRSAPKYIQDILGRHFPMALRRVLAVFAQGTQTPFLPTGPITSGPTPTGYGPESVTPGRPVSIGLPDPSSPRLNIPITSGPTPTAYGVNPNTPGRPVSLSSQGSMSANGTIGPQRETQVDEREQSGRDIPPGESFFSQPSSKPLFASVPTAQPVAMASTPHDSWGEWAQKHWFPIAAGAGATLLIRKLL